MFQRILKSLKYRLTKTELSNTAKNIENEEKLNNGNLKDYSLHSGERQVATCAEDIRKDHTARYTLALQIINEYIEADNIAVLDVFCGNGYGTYMISNSLDHSYVIGIDGSSEAVNLAVNHYSKPNNLFSNKLFPFVLPKCNFDMVICFESLEHVEDDALMFEEMVSSLKPGGLMFVSVPNQDNHPLEHNPHHFHFRHYTHESVLNMLSNDIELIEWYGQNVYHFDKNGVNTMKLIPEDEMRPMKNEHGQINMYLLKKRL